MEIAYEDKPPVAKATDAEARAAQKKAFLEKMRKKRQEKQAKAGKDGAPVKVFKGALVKAAMPKDLAEGTGRYAGVDEFIAQLPSNYSFEVKKTINRIVESKSQCVALQMPEGLLMYACLIADILERFTGVQIVILGDVTYGACCVDDYTARALGADLLVHYAHSCLVNISETSISVMYVFVDIRFDPCHLVETVRLNFPDRSARLAVVGTIQFASSFHEAKRQLEADGYRHLFIPQAKPLSGGELLGCTSPTLPADTEAMVYVADGRFHLESIMIANPGVPAFKYDPHSKLFTTESYDNATMMAVRQQAIEQARAARVVGLIVGTLGRQGNLSIFDRLKRQLEQSDRQVMVVLLSEIFPEKLDAMADVDCWVQIACPRLSIDWGYAFPKPLLNPYEAMVCFGGERWQEVYPQDYYAKGGGAWTNYFEEQEGPP